MERVSTPLQSLACISWILKNVMPFTISETGGILAGLCLFAMMICLWLHFHFGKLENKHEMNEEEALLEIATKNG